MKQEKKSREEWKQQESACLYFFDQDQIYTQITLALLLARAVAPFSGLVFV